MCYSKVPSEKMKKLRTNMHKGIDTVCDHLENNREDQVQSALTDMENQVGEDLLDVLDAHLQSNNQESTPAVFKEKWPLRSRTHCRDQSTSGPDKKSEGAVPEQPEESFFAWACRMFKEILEKVTEILQNLKPLVDSLTAFLKSVEDILEKIKNLYSMTQSSRVASRSQGLIEVRRIAVTPSSILIPPFLEITF